MQPGDSWTLFFGGFDVGSWASVSLPADTTLNGYILSAVPEPRTYALLAGLAALVLDARRRRQRQV